MSFPSCFAYIDPGSGTLALQVILAAALGGLFSLGNFFKRLWPRAGKRQETTPPRVGDEAASS